MNRWMLSVYREFSQMFLDYFAISATSVKMLVWMTGQISFPRSVPLFITWFFITRCLTRKQLPRYSQGHPEKYGRPGKANRPNLAPLKTDILETFSAKHMDSEYFLGRVPTLVITFGEILSLVETYGYYRHICDYSSDVLVTLIGWHSGQLPGWPHVLTEPSVLTYVCRFGKSNSSKTVVVLKVDHNGA